MRDIPCLGEPERRVMACKLTHHIVLARKAAAHKDVHHLVEHGDAALEIGADLNQHASEVEVAHLAVVAAAVEVGVRAGRQREWSLVWSLMDAVHNGGMLFADPEGWDSAFFLDALVADFAGRGDQLGDAIRALRARVDGDRDDRF